MTTSAPGKLMLLGEHAVLYGQPCIVTAVSERMFVFVEKSENQGIEWQTETKDSMKLREKRNETVSDFRVFMDR